MKITRMYCENCGEEFYFKSEYIDHMNMVNNFEPTLYRALHLKYGLQEIIDKICKNGNDYRELEDIDDRLKCFLIWLEKKKISKEMLQEIKEKVAEKKKYIENLSQIREEIQNKIYSLNDYSARCFIKEHLFV